jgi:putative peptidoglycan lipid II flippase
MTPSPSSQSNVAVPVGGGAKAAGVVIALTFASRILGYVRDMLIAWSFGAGLYADTFIVAFRLPNMFRRLVGEGALGMAFIPVFLDQALRQGHRAALDLAIAAFKLLVVFLALAVLLGIVAAPLIVRALAPGFAVAGTPFQLTVHLTRIMLPYLLLTGMVALSMGILNAMGHFAAPALAPLALNVAMISAVLMGVWWAPSMAVRAAFLAAGVVVGGGLQFALQLPALAAHGVALRKKVTLERDVFARFGRSTVPVLLGGAAYQINVLLGTLLASYLASGSVSYLFYADRLVQFPLGIFAISAVTVVMPDLSRQAAQGHLDDMKATLLQSLQLVWFVILPSMVGLIVLREPIVALLFEHGAFGSDSARLTAYALLWYSTGLWAYAALRILLAVFYALQDAYRPLMAAAAGVLLNLAAGLTLMPAMGHGGIALAASSAAVLNVVLLAFMLRRRVGPLGGKKLAAATGRIACCAILMGAVVCGLDHWLGAHLGSSATAKMLHLALCITVGVGVYIAAALFGKIPELQICRRMVFKGKKKA